MSRQEPDRATPPELARVRDELGELEAVLHRPAPGWARADLSRLVTRDFWEIGASGRRYSRDYVLDVLQERSWQGSPAPFDPSGFEVQHLGGELFLLSYDLLQDGRRTRRASVWFRTPYGWKCRFHTGTPVEPVTSLR
jgi:hypothetical protein